MVCHSAGLDCVPGSQLYFVRFRNGACKCFYVVVDFSLCNDERFRDLGSRLLTSESFVNNFSVFRGSTMVMIDHYFSFKNIRRWAFVLV